MIMKRIEELSKDELLSLIYHNMDLKSYARAECYLCGHYIKRTKGLDFYYECDSCVEAFDLGDISAKKKGRVRF